MQNGKKPVGRPRFEFPVDQAYQLGQIGMTQEDIALLYGCSKETVYRMFNAKGKRKHEFVDRYMKGFITCKQSLRTAIIDEAVNKRNTSCLLFAARTYLGLDDRKIEENSQDVNVTVYHEGGPPKGKAQKFLKMNGGRVEES